MIRILKSGETGEIVCEFCGWPFTHTGDESGMQPIYCPACAVGQRIIKEQVARAKDETEVKP